MNRIVPSLKLPCYAVIFTSQRTNDDAQSYDQMARRMSELAAQQPGYLGQESVRDTDNIGITVSYWESLDTIRNWRRNEEHFVAQAKGKSDWYRKYQLRICKVEREYGMDKDSAGLKQEDRS